MEEKFPDSRNYTLYSNAQSFTEKNNLKKVY